MPFLPNNPLFYKSLQSDQRQASKSKVGLPLMASPILQRSASILGCDLKISGFYNEVDKKQLKVDKKRHFWLINYFKKALLANEKALLTKNLPLKNCPNYLKRIKNKNALLGGRFVYGLTIRTKITPRGNKI